MIRTMFRAAAALGLAAATPAMAADISLAYLGQQVLPPSALAAGVGGLSGIDYDRATGRYIAISDDRSQVAPARFYDVALGFTGTAFTSVSVSNPTTLRQPNGTPYAALGIDPESIRFAGDGRIVYSSEGDANAGQRPFVREANLDGSFVRDLTIPAYYNPATGTGIRNNLAFESLTLTTDGTRYVTATENALTQDGPASTLTTGSPSRILFLDRASGLPISEYVYQNDTVAQPGATPSSFTVNGLVEMLAIDADSYLAVERSYSVGAPGTGYSIKLYQVDIDANATNVLGTAALAGTSYRPVAKSLLFDLGTLGIPLDNIEGVTFGQTLADGRRSLVLVSDDNFSSSQFTQFLAFAVSPVPEPATWASMIAGFGLVGGTLRRRRPIAATA